MYVNVCKKNLIINCIDAAVRLYIQCVAPPPFRGVTRSPPPQRLLLLLLLRPEQGRTESGLTPCDLPLNTCWTGDELPFDHFDTFHRLLLHLRHK